MKCQILFSRKNIIRLPSTESGHIVINVNSVLTSFVSTVFDFISDLVRIS